jgi:hypothetical protein
MKPTQVVLSAAAQTVVVTDKKGRRFVVRPPTALDTLRLFKAAGPVLAQNEPWLAMASLASTVTEIDGVPVPSPTSETQVEALVDRLGDDGLEALASSVNNPDHNLADIEAQVGN